MSGAVGDNLRKSEVAENQLEHGFHAFEEMEDLWPLLGEVESGLHKGGISQISHPTCKLSY